jgi:4'-phosphopantetheinyl transferase
MELPPHEIHLWLTRKPVKTRVFIREVLANYLGKPARHIGLNQNIHGKPQLKDRRHKICFNASNSHGVTICAVSRGLMLGVDIEYLPRHNRTDEIAERYYHPDELRQLQTISDKTVRQRLFFEFWTRKEAYIKAIGKTIGTVSLDALPFTATTGNIAAAFPLPGWQQWQFHSQPCGDYLITTAHVERRWQARQNIITLLELN